MATRPRRTPAPDSAQAAAAEMPIVYVTRAEGAPARRGGRTWPVGTTAVPTVEMTPALVAAIEADPGYILTSHPGR